MEKRYEQMRSPKGRQNSRWCERMENIRDEIEEDNGERRDALRELMKVDVTRNLKFINEFYEMMYINDKCLCDKIHKGTKYANIGNIIGRGKVGYVALLEQSGEELILKTIENVSVDRKYLSIRIYEYNQGKGMINKSNKKNSFGEKINIAVEGDDFSNQTCIHMILNLILKKNKNYIYQYDAFICGNEGQNITEKADGDLINYIESKNITKEEIIDIIRQVCKPLNKLKSDPYGFNHNDLKTANILYKIDDKGKPIFKIADYDKSSIYWNGLRFYNATKDYRPVEFPFPLQSELKDNRRIFFYDTGNIIYSKLINIFTMHNPHGFYLSYDLCTFFISLCLEPKVWDIMKTELQLDIYQKKSYLYLLFESLWMDPEIVYGVLDRKYHKLKSEEKRIDAYRARIGKYRSLRYVNKLISDNSFRMKYSISIFKLLELPRYNIEINYIPKIKISKDKHICSSECDKTCLTNLYSKLGVTGRWIYNWDYC